MFGVGWEWNLISLSAISIWRCVLSLIPIQHQTCAWARQEMCFSPRHVCVDSLFRKNAFWTCSHTCLVSDKDETWYTSPTHNLKRHTNFHIHPTQTVCTSTFEMYFFLCTWMNCIRKKLYLKCSCIYVQRQMGIELGMCVWSHHHGALCVKFHPYLTLNCWDEALPWHFFHHGSMLKNTQGKILPGPFSIGWEWKLTPWATMVMWLACMQIFIPI